METSAGPSTYTLQKGKDLYVKCFFNGSYIKSELSGVVFGEKDELL